MKKIIFILVLITYYSAFSQVYYSSQKLQFIPKETLNNFHFINDKFENTTNIFSKSSDGSKIKLNIKLEKDLCKLRIYSFYSSRNWLFIDSISFLVGEETYKIDQVTSGNRNVGKEYGITERTYTIVNDRILKIIKEIILCKKVVEVRFSGNNEYYDFKLNKKNILAMKETLELYNLIIK
jgi:hypothetical protein